jgi:hypothetical protein
MPQFIFQQIAQTANIGVLNASNVQKARAWYQAEANKVARSKMLGDKVLLNATINAKSIGRMFMFLYDPKLKDELPFYDQFPLIFPIELYKDGFLGINMHYLPPLMRAKLMNALYENLSNNRMDFTTKLKINYKILNNASRYSYFKPCVKRYLFGHVRSSFLYVDPPQWDKALMLPLERFKKASADVVYRDSRSKVAN